MSERVEEHSFGTPKSTVREYFDKFQVYLQRRNFDTRLCSPTSGQKELDTLISGFIDTIPVFDSD